MYILMTFSLGLAYSIDNFRAHLLPHAVVVAQISTDATMTPPAVYVPIIGESIAIGLTLLLLFYLATLDTPVCAFMNICIYVWSVLSALLDQPGKVTYIYPAHHGQLKTRIRRFFLFPFATENLVSQGI